MRSRERHFVARHGTWGDEGAQLDATFGWRLTCTTEKPQQGENATEETTTTLLVR